MSCKIVFVGNSGCGKSFLCNVVLERPVFSSLSRAEAVTTTVRVESMRPNARIRTETGKSFDVVDVPGLQEGGGANLTRNIARIEEALSVPDKNGSLVLYVVSVQGGRPTAGDLDTALEIRRYLLESGTPVEHLASCEAVVVNCYDSDEVGPEYMAATTELIRKTRQWSGNANIPVLFTPRIPGVNRGNFNFDASLTQKVLDPLTAGIKKLRPAPLMTKQGRLVLEHQRLQAQIAQQQQQAAALQAQQAAEAERVRQNMLLTTQYLSAIQAWETWIVGREARLAQGFGHRRGMWRGHCHGGGAVRNPNPATPIPPPPATPEAQAQAGRVASLRQRFQAVEVQRRARNRPAATCAP